MSENLLKKEFKKKDVQRARNLISGNFTDKTVTSSGYRKNRVFYKEGDVWKEDGKTWTIKNGIKESVGKFDSLKKSLHTPLTCPKCNKSMSYWLSKKLYKVHKMCFDCYIDFEASLKKEGKLEEYFKELADNNKKAYVKDLYEWVKENLNSSVEFVTEQGDVEDWNYNSKKIQEDLLPQLEKLVKEIENKES